MQSGRPLQPVLSQVLHFALRSERSPQPALLPQCLLVPVKVAALLLGYESSLFAQRPRFVLLLELALTAAEASRHLRLISRVLLPSRWQQMN